MELHAGMNKATHGSEPYVEPSWSGTSYAIRYASTTFTMSETSRWDKDKTQSGPPQFHCFVYDPNQEN